MAAASPPHRAKAGTASAQPRFAATAVVAATPSPTPAVPADRAEQERFDQELCGDVVRRAPSARRSPISVRRSSTAMTMTLAMPMPPTSSATAPRPRNSAGVGDGQPRREGVGGAGDLDLSGFCGPWRGRARAPPTPTGGVGAYVHPGGLAVVAEVVCGHRESDQRRGSISGASSSGYRMPMTAYHDCRARRVACRKVREAQQPRGRVAEDDRRVACLASRGRCRGPGARPGWTAGSRRWRGRSCRRGVAARWSDR